MTFALNFDTDEDTQRVMRVALMRYVVSLEDDLDRGEGRAERALQTSLTLLSREQPWDMLDEGGIKIILDALRHEIESGAPKNATKAQNIIDKVDERFTSLFKSLPPGAVI